MDFPKFVTSWMVRDLSQYALHLQGLLIHQYCVHTIKQVHMLADRC